jgi:hypothetical protein
MAIKHGDATNIAKLPGLLLNARHKKEAVFG